MEMGVGDEVGVAGTTEDVPTCPNHVGAAAATVSVPSRVAAVPSLAASPPFLSAPPPSPYPAAPPSSPSPGALPPSTSSPSPSLAVSLSQTERRKTDRRDEIGSRCATGEIMEKLFKLSQIFAERL
uniref:Uncharacterized protein n=1 Tax=Oryza glumipatula TaxID=40148 RepID=A0A0D9Z114_9ORYZ